MATISHKNLTTTQLHEPKGIDAAAKHDLYFADGVGSGGMAGVLEGKLYFLTRQYASGTDGGSAVSATWTKLTMTTEAVADITGASLSSGVITLPAGTYWCEGISNFYATDAIKLRLRNTTDSTTAVVGITSDAHQGTPNTQGNASISGKFTIATSKTFELQYWAQSSHSPDGLGVAASTGEVEIYTTLKFWLIGP